MHIEKDTKKILMGAVIGGAIGLGVTIWLSSNNKGKSSFDMIGKTILQLGEMIDKGCHETQEFLHDAETKVSKEGNTFSTAVEWITTGINLWNKFKKGA